MKFDIDDVLKVLTLVSAFIAPLKFVISKAIEKQQEKDTHKLETIDINILNEIEYRYIHNPSQIDNTGKINLKNYSVFRRITNKDAPIHIINLIFNCYDPAQAIYIYSKAPRYINFNKNNELEEPEILSKKSHRLLIYTLQILAWLSLFINLLLFYTSIFLLVIVIDNYSKLQVISKVQSTSPDSLTFLRYFLAFLAIFIPIVTFFSLIMLDTSTRDLRLYKKATEFYKSHRAFLGIDKTILIHH